MALSYRPFASDFTGREGRPVGVWTAIAPATWTAEAYRRIYERELLARLPDARVCFVGDLADDAVAVSERGDVMTSLAARADEGYSVADRLVAVAGATTDLAAFSRVLERTPPRSAGFILSALSAADGTIDEGDPVARVIAGAHDVSVRDTRSLDRLRALRTHGDIAVVPDPLVMMGRLTAPLVARSRIEYLRAMDRYPLADTVLVEVSATRTAHLAALGQRVTEAIARGYRLVVVALPIEGETMTDDLRRCVEQAIAPVYCVDRLSLEDLAATIATAAAVIPLSSSLLAAACAFGRPSLRCPEAAWDRHASIDTALPGVDDLIREDFGALLQTRANPSAAHAWCAQLDSHFDRIAGHLSVPPAGGAVAATASSRRMAQLESAQRITGRRLGDERLRFAERVEGLLTENAQLKGEVARRTAVEAALREEMAGARAHARHEVARADVSRQEAANIARENAHLQAANVALEQESGSRADVIAVQARELDELRGAVQRFLHSKSWRYLAPARAVGKMLRRMLGRPV